MRVSQVQSCVSVAMDGSIYHPVKHVYLCVTVIQRWTVNDSLTLCVCRFTVDFGTLQPNTFFPKLLNIPASITSSTARIHTQENKCITHASHFLQSPTASRETPSTGASRQTQHTCENSNGRGKAPLRK